MLNARSMRTKFLDFETLAAPKDYHIIGMSESWLDTEKKETF